MEEVVVEEPEMLVVEEKELKERVLVKDLKR